MPNPLSKGWKYMMASFDKKIDDNADPKVQIQQAAEAAKKQHKEISDHAAEIIGQRNQLEIKLDRLRKLQADHQSQARRAIELADKAQAEGDAQRAQEYNDAAEVLASQLVSVEEELESVKQQHATAVQAAEQAQAQQQESAARLKEQLGEVDQMLRQADQAAMQEKTNAAMSSFDGIGADFSPDDGTPTLDDVRAKIEKRYSAALGAQELYQSTGGNRMEEIAKAGTDMKATARLDEIRASMKKPDAPAALDAPAAEASPDAPATEANTNAPAAPDAADKQAVEPGESEAKTGAKTEAKND